MISLNGLAEKLKGEKRVALICHIRPDGDSLGSAAALCAALEKAGVEAETYCSDPVPEKFFFLEQFRSVKQKLEGEYSALIAMDCADIYRLGDAAAVFAAHKNTYSIDHHVSNSRFAKINYVYDCAANCENVYKLIRALKVDADKNICNLLLTGISTDTGNFRHKNVTPETMRIAADLIEGGADLNNIYYYMFSAQSSRRAKLFGDVMSRIRYFSEGKTAVISVMLSDLNKTGAKADETEGFIDFIMGIEGVEVGVCVMEISAYKFKISLRSKKADVNAVAGIFGGGGHVLASGCQLQGEYEEVIDKITSAVNKYLD